MGMEGRQVRIRSRLEVTGEPATMGDGVAPAVHRKHMTFR
jgi:hypothetical protein